MLPHPFHKGNVCRGQTVALGSAARAACTRGGGKGVKGCKSTDKGHGLICIPKGQGHLVSAIVLKRNELTQLSTL